MTSGSDNIESEIGLFNTFAVFHALGIDIGHLKELLESDQDMLDVDNGDYSVHLARIPDTAVLVKIDPKLMIPPPLEEREGDFCYFNFGL